LASFPGPVLGDAPKNTPAPVRIPASPINVRPNVGQSCRYFSTVKSLPPRAT
jgi:hypothetical protein